ncbi:hypothetical protein ACRAWF_06725 [Streptomyces sp. L7]
MPLTVAAGRAVHAGDPGQQRAGGVAWQVLVGLGDPAAATCAAFCSALSNSSPDDRGHLCHASEDAGMERSSSMPTLSAEEGGTEQQEER